MAIAVQKYIKNMAKSVTYAASDVLSTKFEYVKDFKSENQEVFKEVYHSIKDYRTTFARVKKTITNNKVMDAARVGYDSIMYSITTGDFYAKNKETEVIEKYGGNFMEGLDIDNEDFDWDNEDLSTGDKVVATAIKKNSKIGTALTVEAVAKTGKAQMDVSKENTMLLYTQNERLLNKLDGGFANIMGFLKQNGEQTAKVQNQMNENLNKFMTNVDNNITKLTKQMDELLEMQRNVYNPTKKEEKNKIGYDDIISRDGVINIKEYIKQVKKQGFGTLNEMSGNMLSMIFGDTMGEGSNLLASFAATPFRSIMTGAVNKALGKNFDKAASELDTTLKGMIPSIMAKLNAAGKKEDSGVMGFLGKIFGIKEKSKESVNTNNYNKGAIPFDGITKRAITDVIPYYLRKMTSILTGDQEMVYDYSSGRWTGMKAIKADFQKTINSANDATTQKLVQILESNMGGRRLSDSFETKKQYEEMMDVIKSFATKLQTAGDYGSLTSSDLDYKEQDLKKMLDRAMSLYNNNVEGEVDRRRLSKKDKNGNYVYAGTGKRSQISELDSFLRQAMISQNNAIKSINEGDSILRIIAADDKLLSTNLKDYHGKGYVNKHGDFDQRRIQEMPMAQALVRAKDEYGITLYEYLRDMGMSLRFIKANSIHLGGLSNKKDKKGKKKDEKIIDNILNDKGGSGVSYKNEKDKSYVSKYYENLETEDKDKEDENWREKIKRNKEKYAQKGKTYSVANTLNYAPDNDKEVTIRRIMSDAEAEENTKAVEEYTKTQKEEEDKKWKKLGDIIGSDKAKKLRETSDKYDSDKSLNENMKKVKDENFSSKLMMFTKHIGNKVNKPGDVMADTILKVDFWLQKLLYGDDLKEGEQKKGFFQHMKETVQQGFDKLKDSVSDAFGKLRDKITGSETFKSIKEFFVGKKDDDGIYQGGLFGNFMGGMQRGLRKNAKDVKDYAKAQALAAKNKLKDIIKTDEDSESSSDSSSTPDNGAMRRYKRGLESLDSKLSSEKMEEMKSRLKEKGLEQKTLDFDKLFENAEEGKYGYKINLKVRNGTNKYGKPKYITKHYSGSRKKIEKKLLEDGFINKKTVTTEEEKENPKQRQIDKINEGLSKINTLKQEQSELEKILNIKDENSPLFKLKTLYRKDSEAPEELQQQVKQAQSRMEELKDLIPKAEEESDLRSNIVRNNERLKDLKRELKSLNGKNDSESIEKRETIKTQIKEIKNKLKGIDTMAAGGVNRTGKPFQSVLSAGEYLNGKLVPSTGIYTVPKGGVVVNPADASTRSKQAANERRYLANIKRNAEANDKLSPTTEEATADATSKEEDVNKVAELMTNRDWTTLDDKKQQAEFLGNVASKGLIGGGLGLLVGGPLLGAAVGAASSLTKSTDAFSSLIFGNAIKDKDGNIQVDKKGNIVRDNEGLISKEIMDAVPDIQKFGLGGAIAGLITPLGPLGGILAGSALGFAKHSEIFQGSLFGEGGVLSDENIKKLKKGAKNMGVGAIIGAFTGPFGLVGNALLGATAGYVTSTDKFKDAVLGEKIDPNDPKSKRHGGVIGTLKNAVDPLKNIGKTIVDGVMDAIFGKKNDNDKREGGLFGLIRTQVVDPLIDGTKSIIKGVKNKLVDLGFGAKNLWKKAKNWMSGGDAMGLIGHYGSKVARGAIGVASGAAKVALSPAMAISHGIRGIGNIGKKSRIRKGRADDLTSNERLKLRQDLKMGESDAYFAFDKNLADMNNDEIQAVIDRLNFTVNEENAADKEQNELNNSTRAEMKDLVNVPAARKIMNYIKKGDYSLAERYVKTAKSIEPDKREELLKIIKKYKEQSSTIKDRMKRASKAGKYSSEALKEKLGVDINLEDEHEVDNLMRMLKREKIHNEAGKTEEEIEEEKKRDFWSNNESPLKPIANSVDSLVSTLDKIYNEVKLGNEYDKLSDEEKAKYESKEDYIQKKSAPIPNKLNGENGEENTDSENKDKSTSAPKGASDKLNGKGNQKNTSLYRKLTDIKDKNFAKKLREAADRGVNIFNNIIKNELKDPDKIKYDIEFYEAASDYEVPYTPGSILIRDFTIAKFSKMYEFHVRYSCNANGDVIVSEQQAEDFISARDNFVSDYMEAYMPKKSVFDKIPQLSFGEMIKKSVKTAGIISIASVIPGGILTLGAVKLGSSLAKKFDLKGKAKKVKGKVSRHVKSGVNYVLGSHDINRDSMLQKRREKKYNDKANSKLDKAKKKSDTKLDEIANEMYGKNYRDLEEKEQEVVDKEYMDRYKDNRRSKQILGHGLLGNLGSIKSGVKNSIVGGIDNAKSKLSSKKEEARKKNETWDKLFSKLDKIEAAREKDKLEGKDGKLTKILKWVFVGGIAAPLIVGFVKKTLLPAVHEKIQPWLSKAKEKLIGVKNEQTDEYEGGLVSGIVNPIRKFFKSKFDTVHDWIHSEGKYSGNDKGLKGFWNGLIKVGSYIIDLWKTGFKTIYSDLVPKALYMVGKNLLPMTWKVIKNIGKGLIDYLKDVIKGKQGALEVKIPDTSTGDEKVTSESTTTNIPDTVGGYIKATSPGFSGFMKSQNEIINDSDSKISGKQNEDGSSTFTNETTGKQVTSKVSGDYYSIGTNSNGLPLYKDANTNKVYTPDSNGGYIPLSEYNELMDESLSENPEYQYQQELENNNALEADYTGRSTASKVLGTGGRIFSRVGNMIVRNGVNGANAMTQAFKVMGAGPKLLTKIPGINKLGGVKLLGKLGNGITKVGEKLVYPIGAVHEKAISVASKPVNFIKNKSLSRNAAKAAKAAERSALKTTKAEAKAAKAAAKANNLAQKVASGEANIFEKAINTIKKLVGKIKEKIAKVLKNEKIAKILGKNVGKNSDEIAEGIAKGTVDVLEDSTDDIAKKSAGIAAKSAAKVFSIVMMVADFIIGIDNCRNLLGIISPKPSFMERLAGGIINIIPDVLMTLAEVITGATFGGASVVGGIVAALSIIATIILAIDGIRDKFVGMIINVLDAIPGIDMSELKEKREQAKNTIAAYNAKNNSNLNIEEYNNLIGNKTVTSKIGDAAKNAGSAMFGYDSASKNVILDKTSSLDTKGKSNKVRKKLSTIFSSIWQHFGEKDFNYSKQCNAEGKELDGKEKLNANKSKFNEVSAIIITNLNAILVNETEDVIEDVASNVTDFTGPIDASWHLKDVYKNGKKNPQKQFDIDDEHAEWKRIKAMAGVCAIINEIFEPCNKKADVTKAVLDAMMPAYFSTEEVSDMTINNVDASKYSVDVSKYDETANTGTESTDTSSAEEVIATNANANNKLSSINGRSSLSAQNIISDTINKALSSITSGGFEGIANVISSLRKKNAAINNDIDALKLLPTDKNYWKIELDEKNPFASSLFKFTESIARVIKAPFALASSMNATTAQLVSSGKSTTIGSSSSSSSGGSDNNGSSSGSSGSSGGFFSKVAKGAKKIWSGIKSVFGFGKGKGDSDSSDPFHIYQRDFNQSYNTIGDSEHQSVADSGCGPASAASILRMYGKEGSMNSAVNYALNNNYKEQNGGTYPAYFQDYLGKNGISTNTNATNADVINNLIQNKPVILMGQNTTGSKNTPYGNKYSHYVVARGFDKNGNVIVEDSEDRRGSTRYSLADTLRNTSVRITTGSGRYGRAADSDMSINERYISNVNKTISASVSSIVASALSGSDIGGSSGNTGSTGTNDNTANASINGVNGHINKDDDVKTSCGYTADQLKAAIQDIHPEGCSAEQFPEAAINVEKSRGLNALFTVAAAIQEHGWNGTVGINTTGGNYGNYNVFNIEGSPNSSNGRWKDYGSLTEAFDEGFGALIMGSNYYGAGLTTPALIGERYCPSTAAENAGYSPWGETVCSVANTIADHIPSSGSGRGKTSRRLNKLTKKYGRGVWGRDGEETTTDTTTTDDTSTTTTDSSTTSSNASGLIGLLSEYTSRAYKKVFGDFYDALYGTNNSSGNTTTASSPLTEGDKEANMKTMFSYMVNQGLSENLTAGILGNVKAESDFDPHVIQGGSQGTITTDMSHGYGLIQWTGAGSRACLYNWCTANNCDPETLDGQTRWIVAQIKGTNISSEANQANASMFNGETGKGTMSYNWSLFQSRGSLDTFNGYSIERAVKLWLECVERPADIEDASSTRTEYAEEILAACTGGFGRGKSKAKNIINSKTKYNKYGRSIWGRDGEEDTTASETTTDTTTTDTTASETTTATDGSTTTSDTSSSSSSGASSIISKLTDYASRAVKGVFGDFYDALYGSETENSNNENNNGEYTEGNGIIYAAAMVFEAMGRANPTFGYCYCGNRLFDLECRDGKKIDKVRPDCSGMMSAVAQYMGYYTYPGSSYTDTFFGLGYNVTNCWGIGFCDKDGNRSSDWEYIDFNPNDRRPGDMVIRSDGGHIDMYVFTDTNGNARGFNAGSGGAFPDGHCDSSGHGIENSYNLGKYYLEHNNQLPANDGSMGAWTIQDNEAARVIRYKGSGSGRGKGSVKSNKKSNGIKSNIKKENIKGVPLSVQNRIAQIGKQGNPYIYTEHSGRGVLKSLDSVQQHTLNNTSFNTTAKQSTISNNINNSATHSFTPSYSSTNSNATIDLNQLIGLISVIANNSDKMDAVLQLLGTIAVNTENTSSAITNKNKNNTPKNGLAALRSALNSNNSGEDIMKAVYQIAKS